MQFYDLFSYTFARFRSFVEQDCKEPNVLANDDSVPWLKTN